MLVFRYGGSVFSITNILLLTVVDVYMCASLCMCVCMYVYIICVIVCMCACLCARIKYKGNKNLKFTKKPFGISHNSLIGFLFAKCISSCHSDLQTASKVINVPLINIC